MDSTTSGKLRTLVPAAVAAALATALVGCDEPKPAEASKAPARSTTPAEPKANDTAVSAESVDGSKIMLDVDPSKLGAPVKVAGFEIRPPKQWPGVTGPMLEAAGRPYSGDQKLVGFHTLPGSGSMLITEVTPDLAAIYGERLAEHVPNLQEAQFDVAGLAVTQWYFRDDQGVTFKLLVKGPSGHAQIDYIVPRSKWASQAKSIEASIGSVKPLPPEH